MNPARTPQPQSGARHGIRPGAATPAQQSSCSPRTHYNPGRSDAWTASGRHAAPTDEPGTRHRLGHSCGHSRS